MAENKSDSPLSELQRCRIQMSVLKHMALEVTKDAVRYFDLTDIAEQIAAEEKDVQRSLFVLEGHKLVCPLPPGSLTSRTWCLTETGMSAMKSLNQSNMALL